MDARLQARAGAAKPVVTLDDAARFDMLLEKETAFVPRDAVGSLMAWARNLGLEVADLSHPALPVLAFASREWRQVILASATPAQGETYSPGFSEIPPQWPWRLAALGTGLYRPST